jgi:hypothetical protein
MFKRDLEEQAINAIAEAISEFTVAIDVSLAVNEPRYGSGTLLRIEDRLFILTCQHVVQENYENDDLRIFYKPEGSIKFLNKDLLKNTPLPILNKIMNKSFSKQIPIINRYYFKSNEDDLVLLELDPASKLIENFRFFGITKESVLSSNSDMPFYLLGFSSELMRFVNKREFGIFPCFLGLRLYDKKVENTNYNPDKHFLLEFSLKEDSINPKGFSGCGVWSRLPSGEKRIWTPNLRLVGIQTSFYPESKPIQPLKATKAERIFSLLNK